MFPFQDKVIVITGASSGIGAELARACARRGARVVPAARSRERIEKLQREITDAGGQALAVTADVTRHGDIQRLADQALEKWGRVDALVNNAGFGLWGSFETLPMEEIRKNFETNLFAAVACCQAFIPHIRKQGGGLIVNVESVVGLRAMPLASCYSATKHALHAFSEAMRVEYAKENIQVLSVCPGLIRTEFHENRVLVGTDEGTGPKWLYMPVERCVAKIIGAMERGSSRLVVTGHAKLIAALQRLSPAFVDWVLASNYLKAVERMK